MEIRRGLAGWRPDQLLIAQIQELEALLTSTPATAPDRPGLLRRLAEMGVARIIFAAGPSAKEQITGMERFRDEVMSRC